MPGRYNNYDFVVDSSFKPFSMQEMLVPLQLYKEEYDKTEAAYETLADKSDQFRYLSETLPEGSRARQLYEGYANELNKQANDLAKHGLNMGNRRALTNLKRRYQGEIGRLVTADAAMQEERKLRRTMNAQDSSMLYAQDNLSIDDFMDGNTPNLYNISGTELYTRGAAAGKSASSRVYSAGDEGSTLGGYYRKWVERNGYSKESMDAFRANASAIPELQQAADAILAERGVNENLTGANLERARQSVINGIIDGSIYQEKVNPIRDAGVMSASERDTSARGWASHNLQKERFNMEKQEWAIKKQEWLDNRAMKYNFIKDDKGNPVLDEDGLPKIDPNNPINPAYVAAAKKGKNPDGTPKEGPGVTKADALLKLGYNELADNAGFDVIADGTRQHYDYIGGLSKHGGKWRHGAMGEDAPGTGWGLFSTSNVEDWAGDYSAESVDNNGIAKWVPFIKNPDAQQRMKVLSENEIASKFGKDPGLQKAFAERVNTYLNDHGIDPKSPQAQSLDIQIIEVPNEWGGGRNEYGYLIAIN